MPKKNINEDLERCIYEWIGPKFSGMMDYITLLYKLWIIEEEGKDPLQIELGEEDVRNQRLAQTAYLLSRLADSYAGSLVTFNIEYKNLWRRMEKASLLPDDSSELV